MTQPGEVERPPGGEPGVSVAWRSAAVREVAGPAADKLAAAGLPASLAARDPGLWGPDAAAEAAIRLGWLDAPRASRALLGSLAVLASDAREQGLDHIVLCGMGGSSLAPEVISRAAKVPLTLLDTTDPNPVLRALADRLDRTLVVVSSKSGSTIETDSHRRVYERAFADMGLGPDEIARRFVMVTDPGSPLEATARQARYHVVLADPNVGGRYSALTAFGLVPTALAGADAARLLDEADAMLPALASGDGNPGLELGAALGGYALAGHDKVVLADCGSGLPGFGDWAEQLIAESTGKQGRGILPVVVGGENAPGFSPGPDLHLVGLGTPTSPADTSVAGPLGAQFLVWEYAVAVAGQMLGIDPFDQPNVAESRRTPRGCWQRRAPARCPPGSRRSPTARSRCMRSPGLLPAAGGLAGVLDSLLMALPDRGTWRSWLTWTATVRRPPPGSGMRWPAVPPTRSPSAGALGSCTRPASTTRAARRTECSCRSPARYTATCRFRGGTSRWAGSSSPRRSAISGRCTSAAGQRSGCTCGTARPGWPRYSTPPRLARRESGR